MTSTVGSALLPQIQAGKLRALAVSAGERWSGASRRSHAGRDGIYGHAPYDTVPWRRRAAGTPAAVIEKLNATINDGLRSPQMRELAKIGIEPLITTPREFADIIAREVPKWAAIVKATGVRVVE